MRKVLATAVLWFVAMACAQVTFTAQMNTTLRSGGLPAYRANWTATAFQFQVNAHTDGPTLRIESVRIAPRLERWNGTGWTAVDPSVTAVAWRRPWCHAGWVLRSQELWCDNYPEWNYGFLGRCYSARDAVTVGTLPVNLCYFYLPGAHEPGHYRITFAAPIGERCGSYCTGWSGNANILSAIPPTEFYIVP